MNNSITTLVDTFTIVMCSIIVIAFVVSWIYIHNTQDYKLKERKKWIEQMPSLVSTLGVFGTFVGITKGLMEFDPNNLNSSIPALLDGMKTAFFTSLFGMLGSMILNRIVSHKLDEQEATTESETMKAARLVVDAIQKENKNIINSLSSVQNVIKDNEVEKKIALGVEQMKDDIEEMKARNEELNEKVDTIISTICDQINRLRAVTLTATASISSIDNISEDIKEKMNEIANNVEGIEETVKKAKQ